MTVVKEIQAKTLLSHVRQPDTWFGLKYNMNLYRGCQHRCIYCDSRSECYGIENFADILVKVNAIPLLRRELASKRVKGIVGTGSMNDPYQPVERIYRLTGQALEVIAQLGFPVHILTKSDLVLRDLDLLAEVNRVRAYVSFTITIADDELAVKVEPRASLVSHRFEAMRQLAARGIPTGITMMPILPFLADDVANVTQIVERGVDCGASYIIPWFGMTMRDRQRAYFYAKLDELFPDLRAKYEARFGERYECPSPRAEELRTVLAALKARHGFATRVPPYQSEPEAQQLGLF
jgi:DNA repair photolyase